MGFGQVINTTDDSFQKDVLNSKVPVLIDFWATWCGPCRMYGPVVDEVAKDYGNKLKVCRVNVDDNPNLDRQFNISAIPATFVLKKGKVVKNWVGVISPDMLREQLKGVLKAPHKASVPTQ